MIVLAIVLLLAVVAAATVDIAHSRYRRLWRGAVELLELSDQSNDELRQAQAQMQVQLTAMSMQVTRAIATAERKRQETEAALAERVAMETQLEDLQDGFASLHQLGARLARQERDRAAESAVAERSRRESIGWANAQRQEPDASTLPSRAQVILRLMQGR